MALFKPITTPADLPAVGASRETTSLDFKGRQDPSNQRELAKDVAALANALGGVVLVGAQEDLKNRALGIYTPLRTAAEAGLLTKAYELAVTQRCIPKPVVEVVGIATDPAVHPPGYVVAVNVYPTPLGPIGVRWDGAESFAFPLRTATQTHWMTPTELAMLMVPEVRRIALMLEAIPTDQRSQVTVQAMYRDSTNTNPYCFVDVDPLLTTARFAPTPQAAAAGDISGIPLDQIKSVWKTSDVAWAILIKGKVDRRGDRLWYFPSP